MVYKYKCSLCYSRCPYNEQAMRRAIVERSEELRFQKSKPYPMNLNIDKPVYRVKYPKFYQSSIPFEDGREEILKKNSKSVPSPAGKKNILNSSNRTLR